jgi:ribosome-associated protein
VNESLRVNDRVEIPRSELVARATRSSGPGGQHVNKSSTRVEVLWNVRDTQALTDQMRRRLQQRLASRIDADGFLRVVSSETRSQRQNRAAAEQRLAELVRRALLVPRKRIPTKRPRAATEARLAAKRQRGERKRLRRERDFD